MRKDEAEKALKEQDANPEIEALKVKVADLEDRLKWVEDNCKT